MRGFQNKGLVMHKKLAACPTKNTRVHLGEKGTLLENFSGDNKLAEDSALNILKNLDTKPTRRFSYSELGNRINRSESEI